MSNTEQRCATKGCPVDRYYESWNTGDMDAMEKSLAVDVKFRGPMEKHNSAKEFMASVKKMMATNSFKDLKMVPKARLTEGNDVAVFYEFRTAQGILPMAEHFKVKDGLIQEIECYFDPAPFKMQ